MHHLTLTLSQQYIGFLIQMAMEVAMTILIGILIVRVRRRRKE